MKKKPFSKVFVWGTIVIVIGLLLFAASFRNLSSLRVLDHTVARLFYPLEIAVATVYDGVSSVIYRYFWLVGVEEENEKLKNELRKLKLENHRLREVIERLSDVLPVKEYQERLKYTTQIARVVAASLKPTDKNILIDLGESDGIKTDMGVITPDGVVGIVIKTLPGASVVRLLISPQAAVDAAVPHTNVRGIVSGTGEETLKCRFAFVEHSDELQDGAQLITTGLDQRFPPGLPIGTVLVPTGIDLQETEFFEVKPAVDFRYLKHVLVITGTNW